ncbi:MAG: NADH:flavin oxidoreductase [Proteobacteria bacterium]|nr:NADH:flavin oxidoreductase [Pseudomonadota bacterium]
MANMDLAATAFQPCEVMGLALRNRFIRSATLEGMAAPDGSPGPELVRLYQDLARGGVGLISSSGCWPRRDWIVRSNRMLILDSANRDGWREAVEAVHAAGGLISLQMAPVMTLDGRPVSPSSLGPEEHALSVAEIEGIIAVYALMAVLAREVGLDAVQVHGGHGYPIARFLSPCFNRRDDRYGGSTENRIRLFVEIRRAIAEAAGPDYPVWIKMNSLDGVEGGLVPEQAAEYAPFLADAGYGIIEVTGGAAGGTHDSRGPLDKSQWFEGFYLDGASRVKARADVPVSAVGGIRTLDMIDQILTDGTADLISLSRPLIREPALIRRWESGDAAPARCISCNGCLKTMARPEGIFCVQEKKEAPA